MILHDERHFRDLVPAGEGARFGRDVDLEFPTEPDDDIVSATHARVRHSPDGTWWLEDLGSTNGTWLNGRRLAAPERLRSGDRFTLGQRGPAYAVRIPGDLGRTRAVAAIDPAVPVLRLRRVTGDRLCRTSVTDAHVVLHRPRTVDRRRAPVDHHHPLPVLPTGRAAARRCRDQHDRA